MKEGRTFPFIVTLEGGETVRVTATDPASAKDDAKQTHPGLQIIKCARDRSK